MTSATCWCQRPATGLSTGSFVPVNLMAVCRQMKVALIFLTCYVALSCQQRFMWPYAMPRIRYLPSYYWNPPQVDDPFASIDSEEDSRLPVEDRGLFPDIQGRARPQKKFGLIPANFLGGSSPYVSTFTSIVFTTTTSTVVTATITTCLPASHFFNQGAQSVTCARRRRQLVTVGDITHQEAHYEEEITLTDLEALTAKRSQSTPIELASSLETADSAHRSVSMATRTGRALGGGNLILTSTSTVTAYSFSSTIVKKTLKVVADPIQGVAGVLTCLPAGFTVC